MPSDSEIAEMLGSTAFAGVVDKAGHPYWRHCLRVAAQIRAASASDAAIAAALLHDIVEDGLASIGALRQAGLTDRAIELIHNLTRNRAVSYEDYVKAIADSGDRELILIKLADNADNTDPSRIALLPPNVVHRAERYAAARTLLLSALAKLDDPPG